MAGPTQFYLAGEMPPSSYLGLILVDPRGPVEGLSEALELIENSPYDEVTKLIRIQDLQHEFKRSARLRRRLMVGGAVVGGGLAGAATYALVTAGYPEASDAANEFFNGVFSTFVHAPLVAAGAMGGAGATSWTLLKLFSLPPQFEGMLANACEGYLR